MLLFANKMPSEVTLAEELLLIKRVTTIWPCNLERQALLQLKHRDSNSVTMNHGMVWVGMELKDGVVPTPFPWVGTLTTRSWMVVNNSKYFTIKAWQRRGKLIIES